MVANNYIELKKVTRTQIIIFSFLKGPFAHITFARRDSIRSEAKSVIKVLSDVLSEITRTDVV